MSSLKFRSRWILLPLIAGLTLFAGCGEKKALTVESIQQRGQLLAGVKYDSRPFGYLNTNGDLQGYDIDLLKELSKRVLGDEKRVRFEQVFSSTRVVALNSGTLDVVAATMTITPARAKQVDFSRPYFIAHQAVVVPEGSAVKQLSDLNGKTVLFVLGTTSESNIKKRLPQAKYTGFKTSTDAFSALKAGRGDAMTTDDSILYGFMAENCGFRLLPEQLSEEPYGLAFRKTAGDAGPDSLKTRFDEALLAMEKDGTLARLKAKWTGQQEESHLCKP